MEDTQISKNVNAEIQTLIAEKIKHVLDGDKNALLAHYAEDIVSYELAQTLEFRGKESLDKRLTEWFASYEGKIRQEIKNLHMISGDDVAISYCLMRTYGTTKDGEKRDMWYRITSGYKKAAGKWLIIHEHISEPVDLKTGKALFDLKP
ncbi:MAG: nuclear transport factor 2 family protein [Williamsia sp.]|nr:nuclear transport factor 2 family protein [Williamsia sp.]